MDIIQDIFFHLFKEQIVLLYNFVESANTEIVSTGEQLSGIK